LNINRLILIAALSPVFSLAALGQTPPPPPMAQVQAGQATTHSSRVAAVIYGPQGEVQGLTLRDGVAVTLSPDLGMRLQSNVIRGSRVQVSGIQRVIAGQTSLVAQSLTANGQTFVASSTPNPGPGLVSGTLPLPPPPAAPRGPLGSAVRRQDAPPPPPPNRAALAPPPPPANAGQPGPPPPPDGSAPPNPPAGTPPPPQPQM
jgi:hypothetical protein